MSNIEYSIIAILAFITHLFLNHKYIFLKGAEGEQKEYQRFLNVIMVYYLVDIAWGFLSEAGYLPLLYPNTVAYQISVAVSVAFCCRYIVAFLKMNNFVGKLLLTFSTLFVISVVIMAAVNHFYPVFFWFEEDGTYHPLLFRYVAMFLQSFLFITISVLSLMVAIKRNDGKGRRNKAIFFFCLSMTFALIGQAFYPLLPLYSIGLMFATMIVYVFIHQEETLTQLDETNTAFAIINGLSRDYHSIWWANKEDMRIHLVRSSDSVNKGALQVGLENVDCDKAIQLYAKYYVAEEDRERLLRQVNKKTVLEHLRSSDFYAVNFIRLIEGGGQDYNQIAFANANTADGKQLLVFGFRDINDTIRQEQELHREQELRRKMNEEKIAAEAASASKTKFLQNMSHEIRTPLNAMFGFSQLLGMPDGSFTEEEKAQYGQYIYNSYRMLEMLINDILDIADSEHGNYRIEIDSVKINEACQNAVQSVEFRVPAGVKLYFTSDFADDFTIQSDGRRIQQVLINYLTNACKNTQQGEIHLHCSETERPGQITFSVTDTGRGVPKEKAELIFSRFTKLNQFVQGSGLGLNICQTVAEKLNGVVYLDKTYTTGARFVFAIPR